MVKVFGMIPADDSAPGNAEQCPKGSSGSNVSWTITMQRGETVAANYEVGSCTLHYGLARAVPEYYYNTSSSPGNAHGSSSDLNSSKTISETTGNGEDERSAVDDVVKSSFDAKSWVGPAALWRPLTRGLDCSYSTAAHANALAPIHDIRVADKKSSAKNGTVATATTVSASHAAPAPVTVAARSPDTCCKSCSADRDCTAAAFVPARTTPPFIEPTPPPQPPHLLAKQQPPRASSLSPQFPPQHSGPGPQPGECFGVHVTSVPGHSDGTTPGLSVKVVESHFDAKLAGMHSFDWFLDYNVRSFPDFCFT